MKKKIVFMLINMNIGGTEKALLNMIEELPEDQFDVTILMLEKYGGFLDQIPSKVKVEYFKGYDEIKPRINNPPSTTSMKLFKKGEFIKAFSFSAYYLRSKFFKNKNIFFKYLVNNYPSLEEIYDIAVAYAGPMDFISYFVLNKIKAKKKVQWIHFDITKIGFDKVFASKNYGKFDKIFVVSKEAKLKLTELVPKIKEKTEVFLNVISPTSIIKLSEYGYGFKDTFNGIRILTVGRLTAEKGHDLAIEALVELINKGYNVKWYCLGEGNFREKYTDIINTLNLHEKFILLGASANPYAYMAQCNIYVQPSRHEGYCITLAEARLLRKSIVTTDFAGAKEQITHGETGLIVSANKNEIYNAIKLLIDNQKLSNRFIENLKKERWESKIEIRKLFQL